MKKTTKERTIKRKFLASIQLCSLVGVLGLTTSGNADEPKAEAVGSRIVLRISREFIRKHHLPVVDEVAPIDRCLFGAHVAGESHTKGATTIDMDVQGDGVVVFTFQFKGSTIDKTVATHRPVAVYSTGTTDFEARRAIRFDGLRFTAEPATYGATHATIIDCVATPRGLIGRIARKRAWAAIRQNGPAADAISLHDTKERVLASFNRETAKLVKTLNGVVPYEETVALLAPRTKDWVTRVGRTTEYIIIYRGPKEDAIPTLPKEFLHLKAPVELWIRGKPADAPARRLLERWGEVHRGLDRFRALISSKPTKVEGLRFSATDGWWVIKVGEDLLEPWTDKIEGKSKP